MNHSIVGKINYVEKGSRIDLAYSIHQAFRFVEDSKVEHGEAVRWMGRYIHGTIGKGMILQKKSDLDADFAGNWDPKESMHKDTARSRHGFIIKYAGCPITWKSQLQTEISLSSTESEYTGMSYTLRESIPIMQMLKELKSYGFIKGKTNGDIYCKVFEDNSGAIEMARHHKYRPRTKHLNVKLHHFRDYVSRGEIVVLPISTKYQQADLLTKGLNKELTERHRHSIMGW